LLSSLRGSFIAIQRQTSDRHTHGASRVRTHNGNVIRGGLRVSVVFAVIALPFLRESAATLPRNSVHSYSKEMNTRFVAHFAVLVSVGVLLAGCTSTANGDPSSSGKPLQLRLVTSSTEGSCNAPALTSDGPGSACDTAGTTTYELGKSLGTVTPTSVTLSKDQGPAHSVAVELNKTDTSTLGKVSSGAIEKHMAIVLDGRVLSAPIVKAPMTTSTITLGFETASEAKRAATDLSA
jgi:hypothetical protein